MAIIEQRYKDEIFLGGSRLIVPGEVITLTKKDWSSGVRQILSGVHPSEMRCFRQVLDDEVTVDFIFQDLTGQFTLRGEEINSPSANLRTPPDRYGVYKRYVHVPSEQK